MPNLGLSLSLSYLPTIGNNTSGGDLPASRLADYGVINVSGYDATYPITYLADNGAIALSSFNVTAKIAGISDTGIINISGFDVSISGADFGVVNISGYDATSKLGVGSDTGLINISGNNATAKVGVNSDTSSINLSGYDATVKVSITADYGTINVNGYDAEWEEDFVAVYDPVSVTINANVTNSSAFSIPGKIAWIDTPVTVQSRTATLQTLAADGSSWISTGISWTTSTSVNVAVNSETLAKISGKTGAGLNNFRIVYDLSLTAGTTHIIRSRT